MPASFGLSGPGVDCVRYEGYGRGVVSVSTVDSVVSGQCLGMGIVSVLSR